ncbi:MAG TPA: hypothetical protein VFR19_17375 [Hyphomicrobiaceae bacterium]|nr:hypothetical protein [Hyphomicrobiaceae bacterium]
MPALKLDDATVLTEGSAVVQYIADKGKLQSWLNFISPEVHKDLLAPVQCRHAAGSQAILPRAACGVELDRRHGHRPVAIPQRLGLP